MSATSRFINDMNSVSTNAGVVHIGDEIKIISLNDEYDSSYPGRIGKVTFIDSMGQLHGTWGGLAIIPEEDEIQII